MTHKEQSTRLNNDSINLLLEALNQRDKNIAYLLVHNAFKGINHQNNVFDQDAVLRLVSTINPKDSVETILAIQYIALHIKGMNIMAENNNNTLGQGLTMLRLSHQALSTLQQYRGKSQNINVNYNVHSQGNTVLNTMIKGSHKEKEE